MSDFWKDYEPEPTRPAPMTKDELTEPLGCVVVRPLLANSTTPPAAQRQHLTDGSLCWCEPETSYTDPETGASVVVHKEPQ